MKKATTSINALASVSSISEMKEVAWEEVKKSFERVTSVKCCKFRGGQPPLRLGRRRF